MLTTQLTLNDRSVSVERESSAALGQGFRLGFLGTLHMDVFRQRLEDEYSSQVIITAPTVPYKVIYHKNKDIKEVFISNPAEFPDTTDTKNRVAHVEEPMGESPDWCWLTCSQCHDLCSQRVHRRYDGTVLKVSWGATGVPACGQHGPGYSTIQVAAL